MHNEDQASQVICRKANKLPQIIRRDDVGLLTDEWKIYQGQGIGTSLDIKGMVPTYIEEFTIHGEECSRRKTQRYYVLPKLVMAVLCLAHCNSS